jgi:hypothetical protein
MTDEEKLGLAKTLRILHFLQRIGVLKQVLVKGEIRWKMACSEKRFREIVKEIRDS